MDTARNTAPTRHDQAGPPDFSIAVPSSGYRWWYVDGISDDGRNGIVVIAFVGSVFSPYYFRARQRGPAEPEDYCAINVGLYRPDRKLWSMTERGRRTVERGTDRFRVGPSHLEWRDGELHIALHERSMPFARPVQGRIVVRPAFLGRDAFALDPAGRHCWRPIAPVGRIEVAMQRPALAWRGAAYFDSNDGCRALEDDFVGWNWSRSAGAGGAHISYAARLRGGDECALALEFDAKGGVRRTPAAREVSLPTTGWRLPRATRADAIPGVVRTLEDTPFYARTLLAAPGDADPRLVMHESLCLDRFRAAWVRCLLPFRMPRLPG